MPCAQGHEHWGRFGAAGVLLVHDGRALLARRSARTHLGNTWSTPGGAIEPGEQALAGALRELREELGLALPPSWSQVGHHVNDHGGWAYQTFVLHLGAPMSGRVDLGWETSEVAWLAPSQVDDLATRTVAGLHPGFAATWADLRALV